MSGPIAAVDFSVLFVHKNREAFLFKRNSSFLANQEGSQRQVDDTPLPLIGQAEICQQQNILNCRPHRHGTAYFNDARHGKAGIDTLVSKVSQGGDIVTQQRASFARCPFQLFRVVGAGQPDILNADEIEARVAPK